MKLLVATRSAHKMSEIRQILGSVPNLTVLDLTDAGIAPDPVEDDLEVYETFEENALAKAEYFFRLSGMPTVADDSGLEVDALGGAPGVRSKRFAPDTGLDGQARDDANNRYLVEKLEGVEPVDRTARYVCVAALLEAGNEPFYARGEAPGLVLDAPQGKGGFGYDPYIYDPKFGGTFAEMSPAEKNERSHRGAAFGALASSLAKRAM
ncbi:MAG: non-canonical purine NTP pyrophosphatase [Gemmatimonadota bacterium]|nr:non-canonical purine NTP pyrophosphatase [Gemmatimonadota bacterium]MDH3424197.1 non-canonical purine NTP pyrophosphatase [Gemmatimonadota bacterium]